MCRLHKVVANRVLRQVSVSVVSALCRKPKVALKDAAANAIYGARGANGVVLITTKKGATDAAQITVDAKWGSNKRGVPNYDVMTDPAMYYETAYRALYNSQFYNGRTEAGSYAYADRNLLDADNGGLGYLVYTLPEGQKLIGTNFKLNPYAKLGYSDGTYYYTPDDWYDEIFGKSNLRQEYNVTVSGASVRLIIICLPDFWMTTVSSTTPVSNVFPDVRKLTIRRSLG